MRPTTGPGTLVPVTEPDAAARMIVDGIEGDDLYVFVGRDSRVTNLLTRIVPRRSTQLTQRQMKDLLA